jgi:GDPmannose 4,6-dehydratase
VTRKITLALGNILRGKQDNLVMGNIDSLRDWGSAKYYVEGMLKMLQHNEGDDFVLATGETHTIREFIEIAFSLKGFDIVWKGEGVNKIGYDKNTNKELIFIDKKYFRPAEVNLLLGDSTKTKEKLGWEATTKFKKLIEEMVNNDCD